MKLESSTRLYLMRHGEVEDRYHRVFGGSRIDMELSPRGHEQAHALADYIHTHAMDAVYVSPMKRAHQTLAPLLARNGHEPRVMDDLREVDFGDWTGLNWEEVATKFRISAFDWLDRMEAAAIPGGESAQQLRARVQPCVEQILKAHTGKSVAIVCHGGIVRMMLAILLDLPLSKTARMQIEYGSVTVVQYHPKFTEVQLLNFTPWRDRR